MNGAALDRVFRAAGGRIVAALAARFRDLSCAEDGFAEACVRALRHWPERGIPDDPAAWLYRVAERVVLDRLRREAVRARQPMPPPPDPVPSAEAMLAADGHVIPDERLRLIFICCHPAVAPESRAALTLRLVCGLSTAEVARALLIPEPTLAQRLVRAKRKIAQAGIAFELPAPAAWPERLEAVLTTLELAYAKAHEDAAGRSAHAGFAAEVLHLTTILTALLPDAAEVRALAALVRYAEARRPARLDAAGGMVPLSEQDPQRFRRALIAQADAQADAAGAALLDTPRGVQAALQRAWCRRRSLAEPPPWAELLALYDRLVAIRDDVVVRINRAVVLAEVAGPAAALAAVDALAGPVTERYLAFHAVRADLLRRLGRIAAARASYAAALALAPPPAERDWLARQCAGLAPGDT